MSDTTAQAAISTPPRAPATASLFAIAIFTSAMLVFIVQPMVTKLVLPLLGGSPAVWNTAMVFFQAALLAGYAYAHLLQKLGTVRRQVVVHLVLLVLAALFLPLQVSGLLGDPDPSAPIAWLLGTLALSVGAPFAVLSATAPLLQAWFARVRAGHADGANPYVLYAASNLGSFLALLSYPVVVEPLAALSDQRWGWTFGYGLFLLLIAGLGLVIWRSAAGRTRVQTSRPDSPPLTWRERGVLILLAAAPSSLMLGVTAHLSTDVASAPFLWVIPLALYLLTFVIAFQARPWIPLPITLVLQAALGAVCALIAAYRTIDWSVAFTVNLLAFLATTLMCHQLMAARRPAPDRLTEFYLLLSLGGVIGGALTALVAPVVFNFVWEYPLVLVLVGLARPWGKGRLRGEEVGALIAAAAVCAAPVALQTWLELDDGARAAFFRMAPGVTIAQLALVILAPATLCAFLLRERALTFTAVLAMITLSAQYVGRGYDWVYSERSFFGVMRVASTPDPRLGGDVHVLMHGTTLHGAQARDPRFRCQPMLYYNPITPIGQTMQIVQARGPLNIGVVGQGSGGLATFKRPQDRFTFFEIDPAVDRMSRDPEWFSYISECADGPVRTVLGDARLTLEQEPAGTYDLLVIDAFSSDAVPAHLLTEEAIEGYLSRLRPTGVLLLHLSNRNLDITLPSIATAQRRGIPHLHALYLEDGTQPDMAVASTEALILSPTPEGLIGFVGHSDWALPRPTTVRPWTDDYVNLFGALRRAYDPPPERPY